MYFSFTTLSTVGLGDLHAHSDGERLAAAFLMMIGVAVFTYVLANFNEIV